MKINMDYFIAGFITGFILLMFWGVFTEGLIFTLQSMLSPSGGQVYIYGFRVKHWMIGIIAIIAGYLYRGKHGDFLIGFGSILVIDEIGELI